MIVFSNHNQAPRNTYQCAMVKAALGKPQEVDESRSYMCLPDAQVPLVQTFNERMFNERFMRHGMNVVVAIMCFQGDNQEDSLNFCRQDFHLGLYRTWDYRLYGDTASTTSRSDPQKFETPDEEVRGKRDCDYSLLGKDGVVDPGTVVRGGTAIIGKTVKVSGGIKRDQSVVTDEAAPPGTVTSVVQADSKERRRVKVQIARPAIPIIGDKFSARHGQKGVMGDKVSREDMPWGVMAMQIRDRSGKVTGSEFVEVRPNVIVNPNAIPSRMTVGMLLEMSAGMAATAGGYVADGTAFQKEGAKGIPVEDIRDELRRLGLNPSGTIKLNSGITGEELYNAEVFVGICYYQRLKQLAEAKARAVDRGLRSALTRQPMEGKNGGLRCGEMERDAFIAHGAPEIVTNTFLVRSDDYVAYACTKCGLLACPPRIPDERLKHLGIPRDQAGWCTNCRSAQDVARFRTPYALKLMMQELMTLGIVPRVDIQTSATLDFVNAAAPGVPVDESSLPHFAKKETPLFRREQLLARDHRAPQAHHRPAASAQASATPRSAALQAHSSTFSTATAPVRNVKSLPGGTVLKGPDIVDEREWRDWEEEYNDEEEGTYGDL
jgi:DNA-directed RNA polymerase beta subunit